VVRYDVVLVGFRLNASMKPAQALASVLGLDPQTCKELTKQFPANVLAGVSLSRAEKVSQQLTDVGAKVEVRESRLSHAAQPTGSLPFPVNEESGNYEIGEILAPMKRGSLGALGQPSSMPPAARRPSREELDEALRDSFRPAHGGMLPPRVSSAPPELLGETNTTPSAPEILGNYTPEQDPAFAALQNFEDGFDVLDKRAPALQVDEVALRSIQRVPETDAARAARRGTPLTRFVRWLSNMSGSALGWVVSFAWLLLIAGITLVSVAYAMDPSHALSAFDNQPQAPQSLLRSAFGD
jgi:hypothetical protein